MSNIIIFPDHAKLKAEVAELKEKLVDAINERDELVSVEFWKKYLGLK